MIPWILDLPKGEQLEMILICTVGSSQAFLALLNKRELFLQVLIYLEALMLLYAPLFELPWAFGCTAIAWVSSGVSIDNNSIYSIAMLLITLLVLGSPKKMHTKGSCTHESQAK
jgi:hypothetical protein